MQSFDQSLMKWYKDKTISYESALFYSSNPSEFALRASGIDSASDRTFSEIAGAPKQASGDPSSQFQP
jgi:twitching motility protein PilT